jgi:hypothetical protein
MRSDNVREAVVKTPLGAGVYPRFERSLHQGQNARSTGSARSRAAISTTPSQSGEIDSVGLHCGSPRAGCWRLSDLCDGRASRQPER